jgi:hypothetical protein
MELDDKPRIVEPAAEPHCSTSRDHPNGLGTDNWEVEETLDVEWIHAIAPGPGGYTDDCFLERTVLTA